jgi:hypothetical protein
MMASNEELNKALQTDWELQLPETVSKEEILQQLANKIVTLIERNPEHFFQLMYRLDVPEAKLDAALKTEDAAHSIAELVYNRQLQKIESRQQNRNNEITDDPELML